MAGQTHLVWVGSGRGSLTAEGREQPSGSTSTKQLSDRFLLQVSCSQELHRGDRMATEGKNGLTSLYLPKRCFLAQLEAMLRELFHSWI